MTNASLPCSMNSSPTAQPAYGARYWRATGSAAVAATTTEGSIAPGSRPVPLQRRHQRRHLRGLLADRHVDADQVAALLGDHRVQADRRLPREAVADDQLSLATADWDHGVHGLDSRVHGAVHALAHHHVGRDALHRPGLVRLDGTFAIQRLAQRVHDTADEAIADGHLDDATGRSDLVALPDPLVVAEDDGADGVFFQVQGHPHDVVGELHQLAVHAAAQAVYAGDAVAGSDHRPHVHRRDGAAELLYLLPDDRRYLFRSDRPIVLPLPAEGRTSVPLPTLEP